MIPSEVDGIDIAVNSCTSSNESRSVGYDLSSQYSLSFFTLSNDESSTNDSDSTNSGVFSSVSDSSDM